VSNKANQRHGRGKTSLKGDHALILSQTRIYATHPRRTSFLILHFRLHRPSQSKTRFSPCFLLPFSGFFSISPFPTTDTAIDSSVACHAHWGSPAKRWRSSGANNFCAFIMFLVLSPLREKGRSKSRTISTIAFISDV